MKRARNNEKEGRHQNITTLLERQNWKIRTRNDWQHMKTQRTILTDDCPSPPAVLHFRRRGP